MESGTPLVRLAIDVERKQLLDETPTGKGVWDGIRFTMDEVDECDYLIMLNNRPTKRTKVRCVPNHAWCVIQEPFVPGYHDWMIEGHEPYARVFTHYVPNAAPKYIRSHPALEWMVRRTYDELVSASIPNKPRAISYIASTLEWLPGHRKRNALRDFLMRRRTTVVDIFGRGINEISDKWDALAPFRYSIAVENSASPDYWTEKIADCFLAWTLPLYDGCPNLEEYFPPDSFIRIDVNDPSAVLSTIEGLLHGDEWERRLPAICEARRRVLEKYAMFPHLAHLIRTYGSDERERRTIEIPAYSGMPWRSQLRYVAYRVGERIRNREVGAVIASRLGLAR